MKLVKSVIAVYCAERNIIYNALCVSFSTGE